MAEWMQSLVAMPIQWTTLAPGRIGVRLDADFTDWYISLVQSKVSQDAHEPHHKSWPALSEHCCVVGNGFPEANMMGTHAGVPVCS